MRWPQCNTAERDGDFESHEGPHTRIDAARIVENRHQTDVMKGTVNDNKANL